MAYNVSLVEDGSVSASRHLRISRVYGGLSRRNNICSTGDSSIVSPSTVLPRIVSAEFFLYGIAIDYVLHIDLALSKIK